ncbi:MAG: hypothetical protein LBD29_03770, partial [Treponema sp.]|jgi:hypothetical protein|nr:hypothetical protein [Treponema sp.]
VFDSCLRGFFAAFRRGGVAAWRRGGVAAWRRGGVAAWRRGGVAAWRRGGVLGEVRPEKKITGNNKKVSYHFIIKPNSYNYIPLIDFFQEIIGEKRKF